MDALSPKNLPALLPPSPSELVRSALRFRVSKRLEQLREKYQAQTLAAAAAAKAAAASNNSLVGSTRR